MNAKITLPLLLSCGAAAQLSGAPPAQQKRVPNILYIMSDDHSYQTISCYDRTYCTTPNIDRIAQAGVRFTNSFVCNSLSGPARAVILTGKFSHMNGYVDNDSGVEFDGSQQTMPKMFQKAGYQTAVIGKWHLGSLPTGFDYYSVHTGQGTYYNPDFIEPGGTTRYEGYATDLTADHSLAWLDGRDKGKPFFLMTHFKAPHRSWIPAPGKMDLYEDTTFPLPGNFYDDYSGRGRAAREQSMTIARDMREGGDNKYYPNLVKGGPVASGEYQRMTPAQRAAFEKTYTPIVRDFEQRKPEGNALAEWKYQRYIRDYLKCISSVDDNVGRIIDYLQANDLWENTIVVYCSDQGFFMGEHGWFDKRFMYEESYRTPLVMSYPNGIKKPDRDVDALVQQIDYAPTLLDFAGIAADPGMQGSSLKALLEGKQKSVREALYYHYYEFPGAHDVKRHYGVRTDRYKLIHFYYDIDEWELYDLYRDPHEMRSVYNDPAYSAVQAQLLDHLNYLQKKYQDTAPGKDKYAYKPKTK